MTSDGASGAERGLTHVGAGGGARMVDVSPKPETPRVARAEGFVRISPELERQIREDRVAKGSVIEVARLAGIMGAKRTAEIVPLCHPLILDGIDVTAGLHPGRVRVEATVRTHGRTGVEMEALTGVMAACLAVYDMGKAVDRAIVIEGVRLLEKRGGTHGDYAAPGGGE